MQYKLKHRLSAALMAGAMCCTMIPAASADEIATPETADTAVPEVTDSAAPDISQITENLYNDLPDAPTGSYLGSMGLPVATGETKISISAWVSDLYDGADAHIDADALNEDAECLVFLCIVDLLDTLCFSVMRRCAVFREQYRFIFHVIGLPAAHMQVVHIGCHQRSYCQITVSVERACFTINWELRLHVAHELFRRHVPEHIRRNFRHFVVDFPLK